MSPLGALWAAGAAAAFLHYVATTPAAPPFEQHFAPAEDLEAIDVALIDAARTSIDMAAYVLTDRPVIRALTRASERGVRVRLFRQIESFEPAADAADLFARLEAAGAQIRVKDPTRPLMHLKAYCMDGALLRFGAANFSHSGLHAQDNDLDITRGPGVCAKFETAFETMWSGR